MLILGVTCAARPVPVTNSELPLATGLIRVPTNLANGRVEITIADSYAIGVVASIPITISATRGTIRGPIAARVVANGMGGRGVPSEVTVRRLKVAPVTASAGGRQATAVTWDGRDEQGIVVPGDAYVLILDMETTDGTGIHVASASVTLQWDP